MCDSATRSPRRGDRGRTVRSGNAPSDDHQRGTSMHLKRPSCRGIPRKDHPVGRSLLVGILVVLVTVSSALAWNKAGHMVPGAMAYADLKQNNPETLARMVALL